MGAERERRRGPEWPITVLLLGAPLWWLLGLTLFAHIVLAVPMAWYLLRRRPILVPPGFGWWLLFLATVVASLAMLGTTAPDTLQGGAAGRLPAAGMRLLHYLSATIAMLFVINLPRSILSTQRLVRVHAVFFLAVVVGGLAAIMFPTFSIRSPLALLVPVNNRFIDTALTASLAQVQGVLGYEAPRPSAPFFYTNTWGNMLSLLLVWFVLAAWVWGRGRVRVACVLVLGASLVPIVYSLNRGLWIGLGFTVLFLALRAASRGDLRMLVGAGLVTVVAVLAVAVSPLGDVVQSRLDNPHSNEARENTSQASIEVALHSPILGYGSTRTVVGSSQSIAVGRSPSCPQCGNAVLGGAGQAWMLMVAHGFLGLLLYIGFFTHQIVVYWRDRGPVASAGVLVTLLGLLYMPVYTATGIPLVVTMLAVALLWRQREDSRLDALEREQERPPEATTAPAIRAGGLVRG